MAGPATDPTELRRLRWRARRGLLENDLLVGRFLDRHEASLEPGQRQALAQLLELGDNDLLDLLLERAQLPAQFASPDMFQVLELIRAA